VHLHKDSVLSLLLHIVLPTTPREIKGTATAISHPACSERRGLGYIAWGSGPLR
jgi:hypothetical protein